MEEGLPREISKPWGSELWFAHTESYAGKILRVNAGARLSIQYHEEKDETSFVLSGRVIVSQGDSAENLTSRELGPGESWRNRPLVFHTLEGVEDAEIIEVSTPQLEDVVRLADRYGRVPGAAPSKAVSGGSDSRRATRLSDIARDVRAAKGWRGKLSYVFPRAGLVARQQWRRHPRLTRLRP